MTTFFDRLKEKIQKLETLQPGLIIDTITLGTQSWKLLEKDLLDSGIKLTTDSVIILGTTVRETPDDYCNKDYITMRWTGNI